MVTGLILVVQTVLYGTHNIAAWSASLWVGGGRAGEGKAQAKAGMKVWTRCTPLCLNFVRLNSDFAAFGTVPLQ